MINRKLSIIQGSGFDAPRLLNQFKKTLTRNDYEWRVMGVKHHIYIKHLQITIHASEKTGYFTVQNTHVKTEIKVSFQANLEKHLIKKLHDYGMISDEVAIDLYGQNPKFWNIIH